MRVAAYAMLLRDEYPSTDAFLLTTDRYPPFSLAA
jgi:hypothetical protein